MKIERVEIDWDAAKQHLREAEAASEKALVADKDRIARVYLERADQMAKRHTEAAPNVRTVSVLVFSLGVETYGIPISDLAEVLPSIKCTPVPRAAAEIAGVINLRGELRSVIDLQRLLALPGTVDESSSRILMIRNGEEKVGLKVGSVDKVQSIREDELAPPEAGSSDSGSSYFKGLSMDKVIILNTAALLSRPVFGTSTH